MKVPACPGWGAEISVSKQRERVELYGGGAEVEKGVWKWLICVGRVVGAWWRTL
jgi:hypothetical protein